MPVTGMENLPFSMNIARILPDDVDTLVAISRKTFYEAFHHLNTAHNMNVYMDHAFTREKLLSELHNGDSDFYFAVEGSNVIGYFKLNRKSAQSEFHDDESLEIERIYIDGQYQGAGIGSMVLDRIKDIAAGYGCRYVWLGVWENNPGAIRFYERNGFQVFSSHKFQMGDDEQTDLLMICRV